MCSGGEFLALRSRAEHIDGNEGSVSPEGSVRGEKRGEERRRVGRAKESEEKGEWVEERVKKRESGSKRK